MLVRVGLAVALSVGASAGWSQPFSSNSAPPVEPMEAPKPPPKLQIGVLAGLPRPEGFAVQDLRSAEMKAASAFKQTYKAPMAMPFQRQPVPLAKYERMIGEEELSASPLALLADKLVEHYGDKLAGKRLVVHEFSYRLEQLINRPQLGREVFGRGAPEPIQDIKRPEWTATLYDLLSAYARQRQKSALAYVRLPLRRTWTLAEAPRST